MAWLNGNSECLPVDGQLLAMVLVVWAATFGMDEAGNETHDEDQMDAHQRVENINDMLQEMLYLVDIHGIMRKPTWDGVKVLLLLLPLTQGKCSTDPRRNIPTEFPTDIHSPIDRLVSHRMFSLVKKYFYATLR